MSLRCKKCGTPVSPMASGALLLDYFMFIFAIFLIVFGLFYAWVLTFAGFLMLFFAITFPYGLSYTDYCPRCTAGLNQEEVQEKMAQDPLLAKAISISFDPEFIKKASNEWLACNVGRIEKDIDQIRYFEASGNYENAALLCERWGLVEDAKQFRERRNFTIKEVKVDVNQLVDQLNQRGITININCKKCGAPINVNSMRLGGLSTCNYCGSALDVVSIQDMITKIIS